MDQQYYFDIKQLELINKIGDGPFAEVYQAKDKKTETFFSAKIFKKLIEVGHKQGSNKNFEHEIKSFTKLNHPLLVSFIGFHPSIIQPGPKPVMLTEYMSKGSLTDLLKLSKNEDTNIYFNETRKLIILYSVALAMSFLHSQKIVHCHLKPSNIMFNEDLYPKITDYYLSKYTHQNPRKLLDAAADNKSAIIYLSPEAFSQSEFTKAGDVYSFAMIAYEIMSDEEPFKELTFDKIVQKVSSGFRPSFNFFIPKSYRSLIEKCWSQKPSSRPTFADIVTKLKTDPGFITEYVEKDKFMNYVKTVENEIRATVKRKPKKSTTINLLKPSKFKNSHKAHTLKLIPSEPHFDITRPTNHSKSSRSEDSQNSESSLSSSISNSSSKHHHHHHHKSKSTSVPKKNESNEKLDLPNLTGTSSSSHHKQMMVMHRRAKSLSKATLAKMQLSTTTNSSEIDPSRQSSDQTTDDNMIDWRDFLSSNTDSKHTTPTRPFEGLPPKIPSKSPSKSEFNDEPKNPSSEPTESKSEETNKAEDSKNEESKNEDSNSKNEDSNSNSKNDGLLGWNDFLKSVNDDYKLERSSNERPIRDLSRNSLKDEIVNELESRYEDDNDNQLGIEEFLRTMNNDDEEQNQAFSSHDKPLIPLTDQIGRAHV